MWKATVCGQEIEAETLTALKRKASMIANPCFNTHDTLIVHTNIGDARFSRFNKKTPWGTITYGQWK